jgi:transcriptional regulator GlxA family with amidase domain
MRVVAAGGPVVTTSAGLALMTAPLSPMSAELDTLIVAGGAGTRDAALNATLVPWIQARAKRARRVASVCAGAFVLGAAGLLDGRRAVTHWTECAELARRYPAVRVEPDPIFVRDGAIWSSAGISAGMDLTLALVEQDLGRTLALAVARHLVMFLKRPGGQAQFSTTLSLQGAEDNFGALHSWIANNLTRDLSLPKLAERAGMSERSFSRRYAEATGHTPARAVERLRLEAARRLLSDTRAPVKRIAERCGFGSEETMRRSFIRLLAATPQDYRARFSG